MSCACSFCFACLQLFWPSAPQQRRKHSSRTCDSVEVAAARTPAAVRRPARTAAAKQGTASDPVVQPAYAVRDRHWPKNSKEAITCPCCARRRSKKMKNNFKCCMTWKFILQTAAGSLVHLLNDLEGQPSLYYRRGLNSSYWTFSSSYLRALDK